MLTIELESDVCDQYDRRNSNNNLIFLPNGDSAEASLRALPREGDRNKWETYARSAINSDELAKEM